MITVMKHSETEQLNRFYEQIAKDSKQVLLLLLSERGHGKSSLLKNIVKYMKQNDETVTFKAFDVSLTWFYNSPLTHRQYITPEKWSGGQIANIGDCIYEMGEIPPEYRRMFIATIISQDIKRARNTIKENKKPPWIIYIIEEANTIFNSYSFRKSDEYSGTLQDFVSVGRNFNMGGILVSTAEIGELAPSIRRRRRVIYGRITAPSDLSEAKRSNGNVLEIIKNQKRFNFTYEGITAKPPMVNEYIPEDYEVETQVIQPKQGGGEAWFFKVAATVAIFLLFWSWLMGI